MNTELNDLERCVLAFESQRWNRQGVKEQAIKDTFGLSSFRYYQLLGGILDKPAAMEEAPMLVNRLRRLRQARRSRTRWVS